MANNDWEKLLNKYKPKKFSFPHPPKTMLEKYRDRALPLQYRSTFKPKNLYKGCCALLLLVPATAAIVTAFIIVF
jgi:hypothetical protein